MAHSHVKYNGGACVQYRIRLMERSHVEYNGSACLKYRISLFGTFARQSQFCRFLLYSVLITEIGTYERARDAF